MKDKKLRKFLGIDEYKLFSDLGHRYMVPRDDGNYNRLEGKIDLLLEHMGLKYMPATRGKAKLVQRRTNEILT